MDETDKNNGTTGKLPYVIRFVNGNEAVRDARLLFKECCASSFGFDLSFRDFARELAELPGEYASPAGALLVAFCDGLPGGCVAMRPLGTHMCEVKRLYVRHTYRGKGVGRRLVETVVNIACESGYEAIRVNALPWMREAIASYRSLGFEPIPPYRYNRIAGTQSLELRLSGQQPSVAELCRFFEPQPLVSFRRRPMRVS
jgi:putative acetyltransferase